MEVLRWGGGSLSMDVLRKRSDGGASGSRHREEWCSAFGCSVLLPWTPRSSVSTTVYYSVSTARSLYPSTACRRRAFYPRLGLSAPQRRLVSKLNGAMWWWMVPVETVRSEERVHWRCSGEKNRSQMTEGGKKKRKNPESWIRDLGSGWDLLCSRLGWWKWTPRTRHNGTPETSRWPWWWETRGCLENKQKVRGLSSIHLTHKRHGGFFKAFSDL